jgi:hypothetical protein
MNVWASYSNIPFALDTSYNIFFGTEQGGVLGNNIPSC